MSDLSKAMNLKSFVVKAGFDPASTHEPTGQWLPPTEGRAEWLFVHPTGKREYESTEQHQERVRAAQASKKSGKGQGKGKGKARPQLSTPSRSHSRRPPPFDVEGVRGKPAAYAKNTDSQNPAPEPL